MSGVEKQEMTSLQKQVDELAAATFAASSRLKDISGDRAEAAALLLSNLRSFNGSFREQLSDLQASVEAVSLPDGRFLCAEDRLVLGELAKTLGQPLVRLAQRCTIQDGRVVGAEFKLMPIRDLEPISRLTALKTLSLSNTLVEDIQPLSQMTELGDLDLTETQIEDLRPISSVASLRRLVLRDCKKINDLTPIANLTNLLLLDLSSIRASDFSGLAEMKKLRALSLDWTTIDDLTSIAGLKDLARLSLRGCQRIESIKAIEGLTKLTSLNLSRCMNIYDFSPLAALTKLEGLRLHFTPFKSTEIFSSLPRLRELDLTLTSVTDLEMLASCANLEVLKLDGTRVSKIEFLEKLRELRIINLENCVEVKDLSPLKNIPLLESVVLSRASQSRENLDILSSPELRRVAVILR